MNKKKLIASILTVALLVGAAGASVYAVETSKPSGSENEASTDVEEILSQVSEETQSTGKDLTKEETVYVIADASGQVNKVIVSDWIQNGTQNAEIKDETELEDIKNVKGNESYTMDQEGMCVWDAKGHDIYYQGTTKKALPVDVKVSYKLDGEPISADDIAGKSGKVTIRFDYTNNESKMMNVGGKQEKIYVPFAMLTGTIMDHEVFSNIEVTNGKIINEGEKTIVTGLAFPGLSDDLGVKADSDVEIPAYFEITADAKNFSMKNTVTIATNTIFDGFETDKINSAEIKDSVNKLNDGMEKLIDGSSELYDGMAELLDKTKELATGIQKLAAGAEELKKGAKQLDDNSVALQDGAGKIYEGLSALNEKMPEFAYGTQFLQENMGNLSEGLDTLSANGATVNGTVTSLYDGTIAALQQAKTAYTDLAAALTAAGADPAQAQGAADKIQQKIDEMTGGRETAIGQISAYTGGVTNAANGAKQIKNGLTPLVEGAQEASEGIQQLQVGAQQLANGTAALKVGTKKLADGAEELYKGIMKLDEASPLLIEGVEKLTDGTMELSDGLKKFKTEGVDKITEVLDGDVANIADRLSVTVDVAKSYNSFAGLGKNMNGSTKFIYKTDEIN